MKTVLRRASEALALVAWPAREVGGVPLVFVDLLDAAAWLRSFAGEENARALRAFLAQEEQGARLDRLDDAEVRQAVARRLVTGCAVAFLEKATVLGGRDGGTADESPPSGAPPSEQSKPTTWIEIVLTDMEGGALPGVRYAITAPDETVYEGRLDVRGMARVDGLDPGTCRITFPDFDEEAWTRRAG